MSSYGVKIFNKNFKIDVELLIGTRGKIKLLNLFSLS